MRAGNFFSIIFGIYLCKCLQKESIKIDMSHHQYSLWDKLTNQDKAFFALVERCDLPAVEEFLATNQININMKDYQGFTPLHLAIQSDCEPLVDLILRQKGG